MIKAIQKNSGSLTRATIIIALFSLLSKATGVLRWNILTSHFETGETLDIFYASFRVPDFLFNMLILGTLSAAFIPVFCEYLLRDKSEAQRLTNTIFNLTLLCMGALTLIVIVFAPVLVSLVVPGFSEAKQIATIAMTRVMALSVLFFSLSSVFSSILNSHKRFTVVAAVPVVYNLAIIFGALVLYPWLGNIGLAWGVVLGAGLHMMLQIPEAVKVGFHFRPTLDLDLPGVRKIARLFLPRIFGMDASQVSLLVSTIIGSSLAAGSVTLYSLAYDLQSLPLGVIAVSFAVVAFPVLSSAFASGDRERFREVFNANLAQILYLMIPISGLMLILRAQIVRLVFGRGLFGWEDTVLTITAFGFFVVSLFAQSLAPLFARAFYAMQNTVIPVVIGIISAGSNIAAAIILTSHYELGVAGLAMAFSFAALVNLLLLFIALEIKFGNLVDIRLVYRILKITAATIFAGIATYAALYGVANFVDTRTYLGLLVQGSLAGLAGLGGYLLMGFLLNIPESRHIITASKSWLNRLRTGFTKIPGIGF